MFSKKKKKPEQYIHPPLARRGAVFGGFKWQVSKYMPLIKICACYAVAEICKIHSTVW